MARFVLTSAYDSGLLKITNSAMLFTASYRSNLPTSLLAYFGVDPHSDTPQQHHLWHQSLRIPSHIWCLGLLYRIISFNTENIIVRLTAKDVNSAEHDGGNQDQRQNLAEAHSALVTFYFCLVQVPYADHVERVPDIEQDIDTPGHRPKAVAVRPHCEPQHQGKPEASTNPSKSHDKWCHEPLQNTLGGRYAGGLRDAFVQSSIFSYHFLSLLLTDSMISKYRLLSFEVLSKVTDNKATQKRQSPTIQGMGDEPSWYR